MEQERLNKICRMIEKNAIVADIGTDHGKVPLYLIETGKCKKVIATDISAKSLSKLEHILQTRGDWGDAYLRRSSRIVLRVGDGLQCIRPYEVNAVIVSGLGGQLIAEILTRSDEVARSLDYLVLQPNNGHRHLRHLLHEAGYRIVEEDDLIENGHYYPIIKAVKGREKYRHEWAYRYGRRLIDDSSPSLKRYLESEKRDKLKILENLNAFCSEAAEERKTQLRIQLEEIEQAAAAMGKGENG